MAVLVADSVVPVLTARRVLTVEQEENRRAWRLEQRGPASPVDPAPARRPFENGSGMQEMTPTFHKLRSRHAAGNAGRQPPEQVYQCM